MLEVIFEITVTYILRLNWKEEKNLIKHAVQEAKLLQLGIWNSESKNEKVGKIIEEITTNTEIMI